MSQKTIAISSEEDYQVVVYIDDKERDGIVLSEESSLILEKILKQLKEKEQKKPVEGL